MFKSAGQIVVAGLCALIFVIGWGTVAYGADEVLDPPARLDDETPYQDRIGCTECVRGPYILNTDSEGTVPSDLSYLSVTLESAIDMDVDLVITTEYGVEDGFLTAPPDSYVCTRASFGGLETCEFTSESELAAIRGIPIYIFVINWGPEDHDYTLTADWEPPPFECELPGCRWLEPNEATTETIRARSVESTRGVRLFAYQVPRQTALWAMRVKASDSGVNVDAYVGLGGKDAQESPRTQSLYKLTGPLGEEFLIIFNPLPGAYWIAVENLSGSAQEVEVIALAIPSVEELRSGQPVEGQVGDEGGLLPLVERYLRGEAGPFSMTQYRLALTREQVSAAEGLRINLDNRSGGELRLHVRFGAPVEISGGRLVSDFSFSAHGNSEAVLTLATRLMQAGDLYFAVEALDGERPRQFELRVELLQPEGAVELTLERLEEVTIQRSP